MSSLRKRIAQRLVSAQNDYAMLTTFNEVNMQEILAIRAKHKDEFQERHGVKLGFMSFFVMAAVEALRQYPAVNASIEEDDIIYHRYMDIGIAVSSDRGLVVPIVRNADVKSMSDVEIEISRRNLYYNEWRYIWFHDVYTHYQPAPERNPGNARY